MAPQKAPETAENPVLEGQFVEIDELDPQKALDTLERAKQAAQDGDFVDLPLAVDPGMVQHMGVRPIVLPEDGEDAWERLPGERLDWYLRFDYFRQLPIHERTLARAYKKYRYEVEKKAPGPSTPVSWTQTATIWRWRERAEAWDEHLLQQDRASELEAKLLARKSRRARLVRVEGAINDALAAFAEAMAAGYKPRPSEMVQMLKLLHDEERTEYDDNPAKKVRVDGEVEHAHKVYMGWDPKALAAPQEP